MGNSQSTPTETEAPRKETIRKPQNKLSKPRTNTSTSNLLNNNAPPAASRRNSQTAVPFAVPADKRQSFVTPEKPVIVDSRASSRRNSLSTRQRLRDTLFRAKSSDGRSRASSVTTESEVARDAAIARWSQAPSGRFRGDESKKLPEPESSKSSRPTSRRASTAYPVPYSHQASRLSLVAEAHTPEPTLEEASRRLEQLQEIARTDRSNSDASVIPIRRRSMLMTPGVATRRDSNGDVLYESFPVSRRLSATGSGSRRSSWFDPSNPGLTSFAESPAMEPPQFLQAIAHNDATPRAVTPSEPVHLGAYKPGTLRIINADSSNRDEDAPKDLALEIPGKPLNSGLAISPKSLETISPFSFENSRSPSPQLLTTSKNTAIEDELFAEDEQVASGIVIGSREHALRILDGSANANVPKPSIERSQTSPVRVPSSLNDAMQGSKDYKPLTKNDSGYSSNVSLRSFKAQAEARAAAAKSNEKDASEESFKHKDETAQSNKDEELSVALQSHPVHVATFDAPPSLPEKSEEHMLDAATSPTQEAGASMHWNIRPSLNISRKSSNSAPAESDPSSTKSPVSLLRRLTKNRPASHPVVTAASNEADYEHIPPVSATASAQLEQRQIDCPTLPHTYKSVSRTNSRETLTTILSTGDNADTSAEKRSFGFLNSGRPTYAHNGNDADQFQFEYPPMREENSRTPQRRMTRDQSKVDFETHITSFGTVSESLGASPYDLAVQAMTPRKRSQSFQSIPGDRMSSHHRSHSSNDLAPHNIRSPQPGPRKGMSADVASQLARNKSRDCEIGRRMSMEKLRDDRSALPSNRMTMRTNTAPCAAPPMRSPHVQRRQSAFPGDARSNPPPPVTMSSYRNSLPVQSPQFASSRPTGPMTNYPQPGPWVPQRPQAQRYQSAN